MAPLRYVPPHKRGARRAAAAHGFGRFYSVKMSGGPMKGERQRCRVAPVGSTAGAQWSAADQSKYRKKAKKQIA